MYQYTLALKNIILKLPLTTSREPTYLAGISGKLLAPDGKSDERDALDGFAAQEAQLLGRGVTDHVLQARHKPKREMGNYCIDKIKERFIFL